MRASAISLSKYCWENSSSLIKSMGVPPEVNMKERACSSDNSLSSGMRCLAFDLKHEQHKSNISYNVLVHKLKAPSPGKCHQVRVRRGLLYLQVSGQTSFFWKAGRRKFPYTRTQCHNAVLAVGSSFRGGRESKAGVWAAQQHWLEEPG